MSAFPLPAHLSDAVTVADRIPARPLPGPVGGLRVRHEVGGFPARWLGGLPMPPELGLHVPGVTGGVRVSFGCASTVPPSPGEVCFDGEEWAALVDGVEADRVWPLDLRRICERKRSEPRWRLTPEVALAGAQPEGREARWTLDRVLARTGASLVSLSMRATSAAA